MDRTDMAELGITWKQEYNTGPCSQCFHVITEEGWSVWSLSDTICFPSSSDGDSCECLYFPPPFCLCQGISSFTHIMSLWAAGMWVEVCDKKQVLWSNWSHKWFDNLNCWKHLSASCCHLIRISWLLDRKVTHQILPIWFCTYNISMHMYAIFWYDRPKQVLEKCIFFLCNRIGITLLFLLSVIFFRILEVANIAE